MNSKELRELTLEGMAQRIADGQLVDAYDQLAGHLHEIDDSESPEDLEKRLRDRVRDLKWKKNVKEEEKNEAIRKLLSQIDRLAGRSLQLADSDPDIAVKCSMAANYLSETASNIDDISTL